MPTKKISGVVGQLGHNLTPTVPVPVEPGLSPEFDLSAVAIPTADWNATALFGATGTTMRVMSDRLETALGRGAYTSATSFPMYTWTDTSRTVRGQYQISRASSFGALACYMALCATKDLRWAKQSQGIWDRVRALFDRNSRVEATGNSPYDGWGWGTSSTGLARPETYGMRIALEAGVMAKQMVNAYNMHLNVHLDSTFQTSIDQMMDWWDNHYTVEWRLYYGQTAASPGGAIPGANPTMGDKPLHSKKNFSHTTKSEIVGGFVRAKIRSGSGWAGDPEGIDALNGWNLWYNDPNTTTAIPTSNFRYPGWSVHGPARIWNQRAKGWGGGGSNFTQLQTYLDESYGCDTFLYAEGFLTHALGSQAAADTYMDEVCSGANLGVWVEPLRVRGLVADAMNGYLKAVDHPSGVAGPWMFTVNPFGGTSADNRGARAILVGGAPIMAFDKTNRIPNIFDAVILTDSGARAGTGKDAYSGNIHRLYAEVYKHGRKS